MNFTLQQLMRAALLAFIILLLQAIPWVDISTYFYIIDYVINFFYFFNAVIDVDYAFVVLTLLLSIETVIFTYNVINSVVSFIVSGHFKKLPPVGHGGIGGAGDHEGKYTPGISV